MTNQKSEVIAAGCCAACRHEGATWDTPREDGSCYVCGKPITKTKWKAEVIADDSGEWCGNQLRFDTREQAEAYARDLYSRWTAVRQWRAVEVTEDEQQASQAS